MMHTDTQSAIGSTLGEPCGAPPKSLAEPSIAEDADQGITPDAELVAKNLASVKLRLTFAEQTHQYVIEHIGLADRKATFFFAGCTVLLAYLQRLGLTNAWLIDLSSWLLVQVLAFIATVGLILCAIACIVVVIPRMGATGGGMIFFGAVARHNGATDYVTKVTQKTACELYEGKLEHTYDLAVVCNRKYVVLRLAQWVGAVGGVATLILFVVQTGPAF